MVFRMKAQRNWIGVLFAACVGVVPFMVSAQELRVGVDDLIIEQNLDGGYDLWIRKREGLNSVLLTESTADPEKRVHSYALRNPEYHPANGDEKRLLDGEFLDTSKGLYSLVDSTPESHAVLGEAFRIFVPYVVEYGYPWSREGEIMVLDGTWLNIRAFSEAYGSYEGDFQDNPFVLRVVQLPTEGPPEDNYMDDTLDSFREIASEGKGAAVLSTGEMDVVDRIGAILGQVPGGSLDLVLALDTTSSMKNDIPYLHEFLPPLLREVTGAYRNFRIGMVLYKDYMEEYLTKVIPFETNMNTFQRLLGSVRVHGGRDIPEAVYEAIYVGIHNFPWSAENRLLILVGDAPPHPKPRGKVTKEMVFRDAEDFGIEVNTIILPQ